MYKQAGRYHNRTPRRYNGKPKHGDIRRAQKQHARIKRQMGALDPMSILPKEERTRGYKNLIQRIEYHNRRIRGRRDQISIGYIKALYVQQGQTCYYCHQRFYHRAGKASVWTAAFHIEHKQPVSRGGTNKHENIALACAVCNMEKYTDTEPEYKLKRFLRQPKTEERRRGPVKEPFKPRVILRKKRDRVDKNPNCQPRGGRTNGHPAPEALGQDSNEDSRSVSLRPNDT